MDKEWNTDQLMLSTMLSILDILKLQIVTNMTVNIFIVKSIKVLQIVAKISSKQAPIDSCLLSQNQQFQHEQIFPCFLSTPLASPFYLSHIDLNKIQKSKMNTTILLITLSLLLVSPAASYFDDNNTSLTQGDPDYQYTLRKIPKINVSYEQFLKIYHKRKSLYREYVYYNNCEQIDKCNLKGYRTFNQYINEFADMTQKQFRAIYASLSPAEAKYDISLRRLNPAPPSVDWSCYSGSVQNQGLCGACYAFASANLADSLYAIYNASYHISFSVQELVSCSSSLLGNGCSGGIFDTVLSYMETQGVVSAIGYPYISKFTTNSPPCDTLKIQQNPKRKITDYRQIPNYCSALITELGKGPIAAGISSQNLQFYYQGIFQGSINTITDHAVLIVGYSETMGFKIKNSWGLSWGNLGYGWVSQQFHAGLCSRAVVATVPGQQNQQGQPCP